MTQVDTFDIMLLNRVETMLQQHKGLMWGGGGEKKAIYVFLFLTITNQMTNEKGQNDVQYDEWWETWSP